MPPQKPEKTTEPDPDVDPRICYCMKVHRQTLLAAIRAGAETVEALREATRAGTGCGTCRSELLELLQETLPGREVDPSRW